MSCDCDQQYLGRFGHNVHRFEISEPIIPGAVSFTQDQALHNGSFEIPCAFFGVGGKSVLEELRALEIATPAVRGALRVLVFREQPAAAAAGVAYNADTTKLIGVVLIKDGVATGTDPNVGYRRITAVRSEAYVYPGMHLDAHVSYSSVWLVVLADSAVTHVVGTNILIRGSIRRHA